MIAKIADRLDVLAVLDHLGVEHHDGRKRIACPIHRGDGENFGVHDDGRRWTCFSRSCGAGRVRDAVNLYCLAKHGRALPDLSAEQKGVALRELAALAGVELEQGQSKPGTRAERLIPDETQRAALGAILADTTRLDELGKTRLFTSRAAERVILFLACARACGKLPASIGEDWPELPNLENFAYGIRPAPIA